MTVCQHFNSHAHVERDVSVITFNTTALISTHTLTWSVTYLLLYKNRNSHISTHTLTWSVTPKSACPYQQHFHFNSHAHVERDGVSIPMTGNDSAFQLTRSRGAWQPILCYVYTVHYFNSHAHVERDRTQNEMYDLMRISTHTLTWSVTISADVKIVNSFISTHTLTWSVTFPVVSEYIRGCYFNSHAHVERDR